MIGVVSASAFTRVSVPSLLSTSNVSQFDDIGTYPTLFKLLNYLNQDTIVISNQVQETFHDSLLSVFMNDNKQVHYNNVKGGYDEELLPELFKNMDNTSNGNKLITVHLIGSHFKYKARYPEHFDCFEPDNDSANYLSSIRYTDAIVRQILAKADNLETPMVIIYTPDHGEYVNDQGDDIYGHGFKKLIKPEIEIPLIFLFNQPFLVEYQAMVDQIKRHSNKCVSQSNKCVSQDNISHTILDMLGVKGGRYLDLSYSVASKEFIEHDRYIVERSMDITRLVDLEFEDIGEYSSVEGITLREGCLDSTSHRPHRIAGRYYYSEEEGGRRSGEGAPVRE